MKRLALLCGAGISIPVGMPKTQDITYLVLSENDIARHTDMSYYLDDRGEEGEPSAIDRDSPRRVRAFLDILKRECDRFYHCDKTDEENADSYETFGKHVTNYEDLYYLAEQIHDCDTHEFENPAIQPLIDKLLGMDEVKRILAQGAGLHHDEWDFGRLHSETCGYIRSVVSSQLSRKPENLDRLKVLCDACQDGDFSGVDIYTLNHDTVLEELLEVSGINYADGFSEPVNEVRYWDPQLLDDPRTPVHIHKLHGGADWYRFGAPGGTSQLGIATCSDWNHTKSPEGDLQWRDPFPEMLMGTFNKLMNYTSGLYAELYCRFILKLKEVDRLVIAGYGFGDKGINEHVLKWVVEPGHKAVVIEPNTQTFDLTARGAVRKHWKKLRDDGKLLHMKKGIEETTWGEICEHLDILM